ncbi:MAG: hypothetical protein V4561_02700 [Bacteroidota bacterium]
MTPQSKAKTFYISVIAILICTTLFALYDGGYGIEGGTMAGIALASIIISFLPFYLSLKLFNKYSSNSEKRMSLKFWALFFYIFCFPIKIWIIYCNIAMVINGGKGWSFG